MKPESLNFEQSQSSLGNDLSPACPVAVAQVEEAECQTETGRGHGSVSCGETGIYVKDYVAYPG